MIKAKFQRVNRTRIFEQAVEQIRSLIESGELPPGEKLPTEQELSDALNMGRSSIREAIRVLEVEGLVEVRQGDGTYVAPRSSWGSPTSNNVMAWLKQRGESVVQLLQVREYIEGLTASLAAKRHTPEIILELTTLVDQLAELMARGEREKDLDAITNLNTQFHLTISRYSGNDFAHEILSHILPAFLVSNKAVLFVNLQPDLQVNEHRKIIEAIKKGDAQEAESLMRSHIARVEREVQDISDKP